MHNKGIGAIRAEGSTISFTQLFFFSSRLTVLQLKFNFNCNFRSLNCISAGRTQHLFPYCANTVRWQQPYFKIRNFIKIKTLKMAIEFPPYVQATGILKSALEKIIQAPPPPRFTQDFLSFSFF